MFAVGHFSLYNPNIMSAVLEAVRDKPLSYFQMDDTAPFQDYSGFNVAGTMDTGTAGKAIALMSGASYSTVFSSANVGKFPSPVFKQGFESDPFTLEAWVYLQNKGADAEVKILSNAGTYDGLTINGTTIAFTTSYSTTGTARADYDIQVSRRVHVVGVHTSDKNSLYVDGVLVSEIEISDTQKLDTFVAAGGNLYSGTTTSTDAIAVNGIGIYAKALGPDAIARHYAWGNRHVPKDSIPSQFRGVRIPLSQNEADVFLEQTWTTEFDWTAATLTDTVVVDDSLRPRLSAGVSVAGTWLDVFALDAADVTSVYGVNMLWDGEGAIVEASLDGVTWETAVRGKNLALIPSGFDPTDKELKIRISFPGGISDDPSFVDNLTVTGFKTGAVPAIANRAVTTTGYVRNDYEPVELRDDWGTKLPNTATLTIAADTSPDAVNPKTIEIWSKGTFTTNLTGVSATYSNGSTNYTPAAGDWQVREYIFNTGLAGNIVITSTSDDTIIGQVVLYPDAKTATDVAEIYNAYTGLPKTTVGDVSVITVAEPATAASIYDYDWSISASG